MASTTGRARGVVRPDLATRRWPAEGEPWASLLIVHGLAEHSGRYERAGALFAAAGIDTHAFDLRGFGASGGRRAYVDSWSDYLDDVEERLAALRADAAPRSRPVVLLGHSLGGLIALDYATSGRPAPDLLVLSAPALESTVSAARRALAAGLARLAPRLMVSNGLRGEQLSRDPAVADAYFADVLVVPRSTTRLAVEGFSAQARVRAVAGRLSIPTLVIHGADDSIVPVAASEPLGHLSGVQRIVYPGLRHESFNEAEGPAVVADVIAWLRERVAGR